MKAYTKRLDASSPEDRSPANAGRDTNLLVSLLSSIASDTPGHLQRLRTLVAGILILYVGLAALPDLPRPMEQGVDAGYVLGLNMAHAQGLVHGKDIVWTYGPLGYLNFPDPDSANPGLALAYRLGIWGIWLAALAWVSVRLQTWLQLASVFLVFLVSALGIITLPGELLSPGELLEWTIVLLAAGLIAFPAAAGPLGVGAFAFVAALCALYKFNLALEGALLLGFVVGCHLLSRHVSRTEKLRHVVAVAIWPLSVIAICYWESGTLMALWPWVKHSVTLARGYAESVSMNGPLWQVVLAVATLAALFIGIPIFAKKPRDLFVGLAAGVIVTFFIFKHCFVRQDGHAAPFQIRMAMVALFPMLLASTSRDRRLIFALQIVSLLAGFQIMKEAYPSISTRWPRIATLREPLSRVAGYVRWSSTLQTVRAEGNRRLQIAKLPLQFQQLIRNGTVDAFPWDVALIRANGWKWHPRPIFQSYTVDDPSLDRMNADHIRNSSGPEFALVTWTPVDQQHPFFVDPLSWRALFERYEAAFQADNVLAVKRRSPVSSDEPTKIGSTVVKFGEEINVPNVDGLAIAKIQMDLSLQGKLRNLLFRPDIVYFRAKYYSGKMAEGRAIRPNLINGAIVNRIPQSLRDLALFFGVNGEPTDTVEKLSFITARPEQYRSDIRIDWYRLPLRNQRPFLLSKALPENSRVNLWSPRTAPARVEGAISGGSESELEIRSTSIDPQVWFSAGPELGRYQTIVVRARFSFIDRISLFFGQFAGGRAVEGFVPKANEWLDIYVNVRRNPFWATEHGEYLRFDPGSEQSSGGKVEIAGIWGLTQTPADLSSDMEFFRPAEVPQRRFASRSASGGRPTPTR